MLPFRTRSTPTPGKRQDPSSAAVVSLLALADEGGSLRIVNPDGGGLVASVDLTACGLEDAASFISFDAGGSHVDTPLLAVAAGRKVLSIIA